MKEKIKKYWWVMFIIIFIVSSFYWFGIRMLSIKRECLKYVVSAELEVKEADFVYNICIDVGGIKHFRKAVKEGKE